MMRKIHLSTYLGIFITTFAALALLLIAGSLYVVLSTRLSSEFRDRVRAEGMQSFLQLDKELLHVENRVKELAMDNAIRVTLMLGAYNQVQERVDQLYASSDGDNFSVLIAATGTLAGQPPKTYPPLRIRELANLKVPFMEMRIDEENRLTFTYALPITRRNEMLGTAICVHHFGESGMPSKTVAEVYRGRLLYNHEGQIRDLISGQILETTTPAEAYDVFRTLSRISIGGEPGFLLTNRNFPQIVYFAPMSALTQAKMSVFRTIAVLSLLVLLTAALVSFYLSRKLGLPLASLSQWALDTAHRRDTGATNPGAAFIKEVDRLVFSLNLMLTNLKKAEELARYQELFNVVSDAVFINDSDGVFIEANQVTSEIFGYSWPELSHMKIRMLFPPESADHYCRQLQDSLENTGHDTMEAAFLTRTGILIPVEIKARKVVYRGRDVILSIVRDATKRKMAEEGLRESEEKYRTTFQSAPDPIIITDLSTSRFVEVNQGFCESLGYSLEETVGKTAAELELTVNPSTWNDLTAGIHKQGGVKGLEDRLRTKSGEYCDTIISAKPIRYSGRDCMVTVLRDISSLKKAEREQACLQEQLLHAQKMQAVGTLAGGVAHDFNNILQALGGYLHLLLHNESSETKSRLYLEQMEASLERAGDLVRRLLTFSRKMETTLNPVELNEEILQAVDMLRHTIPRMIEITTELADGLKIINGDGNQLVQMLINLATNARDAMPEGGRLLIRTENIAVSDGHDTDVPAGEYILLTVEDTGLGMDAETLRHAYDPFFTTKGIGEGTGLGLSTVYGIVKSHGGHITCRSEPGQGTSFAIYLPVLLQEGVRVRTVQPPRRQLQGGNETILLVDDEKAVLDIGQEALTSYGYQVLTAGSGEEALELYNRFLNRIDLTVLDLGMPGMGGYRCLEELLDITHEAKVIVASGYANNARLNHYRQAYNVSLMPKPYKVGEFLSEVRRLLDSTQTG